MTEQYSIEDLQDKVEELKAQLGAANAEIKRLKSVEFMLSKDIQNKLINIAASVKETKAANAKVQELEARSKAQLDALSEMEAMYSSRGIRIAEQARAISYITPDELKEINEAIEIDRAEAKAKKPTPSMPQATPGDDLLPLPKGRGKVGPEARED